MSRALHEAACKIRAQRRRKTGRAALVDITNAGRALLDARRRDRRDRLAELLIALSPQDEAALTLAAHVALPIIRQLVHNATNPARSQTAKTA